MRINVPLMPVVVEVRWRRLSPVRVSLRDLMVAVIFASVFLAISARLMRLNRLAVVHQGLIAEERLKLARPASSNVVWSPTVEQWHEARMREAQEGARRYDRLFFALILSTYSVTVWFALGRLLNTFVPKPESEAGTAPDPPVAPAQL